MEKILVIGASGQIGSELVMALRKVYGDMNVFATDIKDAPRDIMESGPFQIMDALDDQQLTHFVVRHKITHIYHLAAVLSGNAEKLPLKAWDINMRSLLSLLEISRECKVKKVFWPSSIAVFGPSTPRENTPAIHCHGTHNSLWYQQACRGTLDGVLFQALRVGCPQHPLSGLDQL